jgi:hypothetical protein
VQTAIGIESNDSDISELVNNWPFSNKRGKTATQVHTNTTVALTFELLRNFQRSQRIQCSTRLAERHQESAQALIYPSR